MLIKARLLSWGKIKKKGNPKTALALPYLTLPYLTPPYPTIRVCGEVSDSEEEFYPEVTVISNTAHPSSTGKETPLGFQSFVFLVDGIVFGEDPVCFSV